MKKVSVYIPCFNAENTIESCLDAVLKQTYPVERVVIVDDGSTDKTVEIASAHPVKVIRQANKGLAAARNTAVKNIDTEFIASVDADCLPEPDWLKRLMIKFRSPKVSGAGGKLLEAYSSTVFDLWRSVHMKQYWTGKSRPDFLFGSNAVFRREALVKAGLYNEDLKNNYEDVEICKQLKAKGYTLAYEPEAIADHIKDDNLCSILNSYWKWNLEHNKKNKYYANQKNFNSKIKDNFGLAYRYFEEDYASRNYQLLYLDFLLGLHHSLKDLEYFIHKAGRSYSSGRDLASFWLSLLDLTFFYHLDATRKNMATLIRKQDTFLQNFFAMNLILGEFMRQKFNSDHFSRILYKHLLLTIYNINDDYLLEKLLNLIYLDNGWKTMLNSKHANLNQGFLEAIDSGSQQFWKYAKRLTPKIVQMIEISADKIDKITYF